MMTPWFAAGAGIVIAVAMAVDSQAALTYAPSGPSVRCPVSGCASPARGHPPDLATARPGVALKTPRAGPAGAAAAGPGPRPGAEADYRLGYQVIRRWHSGFVAMITMPGDLKPGSWSLHFAFPSARVDRVWGAQWQPSRNGDGGTALGPSQWRGRIGPDARQLQVSATGTPTDPSACRLDGISCGFG
jgi:Cellulose binding domain